MPRKPRPRRVQIARYELPDGTRCTKSTPGAIRTVQESETWYGSVGGRLVSLGTTDEGLAWAELRRLLRRQADEASGIWSLEHEQQHRTLIAHVEDWITSVKAAGTSGHQIGVLRTHVLRIADLAGWSRLSHITHDTCLQALAQLQNDENKSAQTRNHHLAHVRQFVRWCVRTQPKRLSSDPLEGLSRISVAADRRHDRRCPTDAEVELLFASLAAPDAPERMGLDARTRALGYKVAMCTGFRAFEMRALEPSFFDLTNAFVSLPASKTKNRRAATQPLPDWLNIELHNHFDNGGKCWAHFPERGPGKHFRRDLESAGVEYSIDGPDGPLFFDFHSLRVWYITQLASSPGIDPKTLMTLARHSDPRLTLAVYAKGQEDRARAAAQGLPRL